MHLEVIDDAARLPRFEPEWWELWRRARATPFQSPAWIGAWLECFAKDAEPHVITLRDGSNLAAVLPLFFFHWQGQRWCAPVGAGISDYLDVMVDPKATPFVAEPLRAALEQAAQRVDVLKLEDVPEGSPLTEAASGLGVTESCAVCPKADLGSSLPAYLERLPSFLRRNLRQGSARLERRGVVTFRAAGPNNVQSLLDVLFELHSLRWRSLGQPGVFADEAVREFHRRAAPGLLAASALRLLSLELGGRPIGVVYVLHGRDAHYYASGFDPEFYDCSPGSLLIAKAIGDASEQGKRCFDFLRGQEPYKYDWGAQDHFTHRLTLRGSPCTQEI